MKAIIRAAAAAAVLWSLSSGIALGQVTEDSMGKIVPVTLAVCNFRDGQDAGDLDRVVGRWNRYMDEKGADYYSAWTLTPYFYGPQQNVDMIWMGVYRDANAFGAEEDSWMATGGDLQEAFGEVTECSTHIGLNSAMYKAPEASPDQESAVISIMDCTINDGHRYSDVRSAELKWVAHLESVGSTAGVFHWFPRYGGGTAEYNYKVVNAYANFTEMGKDMERRANGGDFGVSRDIFRDVDECDDARVYVMNTRRVGQIR